MSNSQLPNAVVPSISKAMPTQDKVREDRITMEIIVDFYNEHEAWSGWWC